MNNEFPIEKLGSNKVKAPSQRANLLHHLKNVGPITTSQLHFRGFLGIDGKRCVAKNWSSRVKELRDLGEVIEGIVLPESNDFMYVYHGHFNDLSAQRQEEVFRAGWVFRNRRRIA